MEKWGKQRQEEAVGEPGVPSHHYPNHWRDTTPPGCYSLVQEPEPIQPHGFLYTYRVGRT